MGSQSSVALLVSWSPSMASKSNGLIRMDKEIFFSLPTVPWSWSFRVEHLVHCPYHCLFSLVPWLLDQLLVSSFRLLPSVFSSLQPLWLFCRLPLSLIVPPLPSFVGLISFLLACFSFSLLSSSSSLALCFLHSLIYSRSC